MLQKYISILKKLLLTGPPECFHICNLALNWKATSTKLFQDCLITSLIFTKTTTQVFIAITSLYYKTYNSLYDVIVSLMLKSNCFKETKLYLPVIVVFFFIVFYILTDFFNHKENYKVLANVNKMRKR